MNGTEWIVDAQGCCADQLRSLEVLQSLFAQIISELDLRTVGQIQWHQFPGTEGITGLCLLSESHLTCHTFPEYGSLCLNLFCCVPRARWEFESQLSKLFGATLVQVKTVMRDYCATEEPALASAARKKP